MSSSCGRHDRKMQSVRKTPRSHVWWSFVWVSWRLQLLAGWRLQPSNLHAAGWDELRRANEETCRFTLYWHLIQHWWITVATTSRAERWIVQATLFFYDLFWRVKDDRCHFSRRLHVNIRKITHRWFCQRQKNWSHSVSGRCVWTPSVCRRPALPRRKKVLDFFLLYYGRKNVLFWSRLTFDCFSRLSLPFASHSVFVGTELGFYKLWSEEFGFTVTIDNAANIALTLTKHHANQTCGLCGNFSSISADEYTAQEGKSMWASGIKGKCVSRYKGYASVQQWKYAEFIGIGV